MATLTAITGVVLLLLAINESTLQEKCITVISIDGTNTPDCFNQGVTHPGCNTLKYLLESKDWLSKLTQKCTILVKNNQQLINEGIQGVFINTSLVILNITGVNNPIINCSNSSGVSFTNSSQTVSIIWESIDFQGCGVNDSGSLKFRELKAINIVNSKFSESEGIMVQSVASVTITGCHFVSSYVPVIDIDLSILAKHFTGTVFNNTIKEISSFHDNVINVNVAPEYKYAFHMIFDTNIFKLINYIYENVIAFSSHSYQIKEINLIINGCFFTFNKAPRQISINITNSSSTKVRVLVNDSQFIGNYVMTNTLLLQNTQEQTGLIVIYITGTGNKYNTFKYSHNTFQGNQRGSLMNVIDYTGSYHTMSYTKILENSVPTKLIKFEGVNDNKLPLIIQSITLSINVIMYDWTYANDITGILYITNASVVMIDSDFSLNFGSALTLLQSTIDFQGNVSFQQNTGIQGGALHINYNSSIVTTKLAYINITNNTAQYGGAIYIGNNNDPCILDNKRNITISFIGNDATALGPSIYSVAPHCHCNYSTDHIYFDQEPHIVSSPTNISTHRNKISVFPGESIAFNVTSTDCSGVSSSCLASISLVCKDPLDCQKMNKPQIINPSIFFIATGKVDTGIKFLTNSNPTTKDYENLTLNLIINCIDGSQYKNPQFQLNVLGCPQGLVYSNITKQCQCTQVTDDSNFACNDVKGMACIRKGYWYGTVANDSIYVIAQCTTSQCNININDPCPNDVVNSVENKDFVLLSKVGHDQCINGHTGIMCIECKPNTSATLNNIRCIQYNPAHPYILLLMIISWPLLVGIVIILVVQFKQHCLSSYLYGPLFFLAVAVQIPLSQNTYLSNVLIFFESTMILGLQMLGTAPLCFFQIGPIWLYSLNYIAPIIIVIVLVMTFCSGHCYPRIFLKIQRSPVPAMCLLILLSFWSLSQVCIKVIVPVSLTGVSPRVAIQPTLPYLHGEHVPLWLLGVSVLIALAIVSILLVVSPFLSKKINLIRMKPFLDEFQSCYHDNYRWYAGVYFCAWLVIEIIVTVSSDFIIVQTILAVLLIGQFLLQPYKSKWLNTVDGLFLLDLVLLIPLSQHQTTHTTFEIVLMYILILGPLIWMVGGVLVVIANKMRRIQRIKKCFNKCKKKQDLNVQYVVTFKKEDISHSSVTLHNADEREPLLGIISETENKSYH